MVQHIRYRNVKCLFIICHFATSSKRYSLRDFAKWYITGFIVDSISPFFTWKEFWKVHGFNVLFKRHRQQNVVLKAHYSRICVRFTDTKMCARSNRKRKSIRPNMPSITTLKSTRRRTYHGGLDQKVICHWFFCIYV